MKLAAWKRPRLVRWAPPVLLGAWVVVVEAFVTYEELGMGVSGWMIGLCVSGVLAAIALSLLALRARSRSATALSRQLEAEVELRAALAEAATLRDLLPVCASCKHIRTDDDQWETLEQHVQRAGASLSHGLCPDCVVSLYPEFASGLA